MRVMHENREQYVAACRQSVVHQAKFVASLHAKYAEHACQNPGENCDMCIVWQETIRENEAILSQYTTRLERARVGHDD